MNKGILGLMWLLMGSGLMSGFGAGVHDSYDAITTTTGTVYKNCMVTKVEPDAITVVYGDGAVKVPFTQLSTELQQKYHYDPAVAEKYLAEQAAKRQAQLENALKSQPVETKSDAATESVTAPRPKPRIKYTYDDYDSILSGAQSKFTRVTLRESDAFSLSQLEEAKKKAIAEHKPLGFMMMWGQFFDKETDLMGSGGSPAAAHFYYVFRDQVVLVFVRHETELDRVPDAVKQGFFGPDEGGYAPNMAVTDATAQIYVCEIPCGGLDNAGRTKFFRDGFVKIRAAQAKWDEEEAKKASAPASPSEKK